MNEEKILGFLNINKHAKHNKFLDKIYLGFNAGFTLMIGGSLLLSALSELNIAFTVSFVVLDLLLALAVVLNKNPAISYIITSISLFLVIAKLLIGYVIFSELEFVESGILRFSWAHLSLVLIGFWLSVYLCILLYRNYKIIEKYPIQEAKSKIREKYRVPKWLPIASAVVSCPMVFVRLLRDGLTNSGLGIGFILLLLICAFVVTLSVCLFKCIVVIRFKAYKFFG